MAEAAGLPVSFTDLNYQVKVKKEMLPIITSLSGHFEPQKMTALMGPSGSGKTTLMDILSGRKSGAGTLAGEVLFGGSKPHGSTLQDLCGYVEQFDTLVGELTVGDMLAYTAELKLPRSMSAEEKKSRTEEVIEKLRLLKCRNTKIGTALQRGISGGQAKRVNIALALITRPKVIFLDEPTSGLDSRMANEVCGIMKSLAKDGRTVVATIHSPTSYAFSLFDALYMLQGGKAIYDGPVGGITGYFETLGHKFPSESYSLPDWIVDITSGPSIEDDSPANQEKAPEEFSKLWADSNHGMARAKEVREAVQGASAVKANLTEKVMKHPGQLHALKTLLRYRMAAHYKDGEFLGPRIGDKVFMALLILSLYFGIGDQNDGQSIQSTSAVLYFLCALCGYGAAAYVPSLTLERTLFYRERADGCYWAVTYYVSKFIEEAVLATITSLFFGVVMFYGCSLQGSFIVFAGTYYLTAMVGIVLAYTVAAVAPNMEAANALLPTYVTTCMYFGGLFLLFDKIPVWWNWYSYTSFLRYAWGALMLNQFKDTTTGSNPIFWNQDTSSYENILEFYGMSDDDGIMGNLGLQLVILTVILAIVATCGSLALTFMSHVKR